MKRVPTPGRCSSARPASRILRGAMLVAVAAVALLTMPSGAPLAQGAPTAPAIASVAAINGTLSVQRAGQGRWCDGYVQMPDYLQDRLKTDTSSMAAIDFNSGGRVGINKGSEVLLTSTGATSTGAGGMQTLSVQSGTVWAKFQKQEKPLRIQTKTAVFTIKGTEFVVEAASNDSTTLSVLEGEVGYAPIQENGEVGAEVGSAQAGAEITINYKQVPVAKQYEPKQLRKSLEGRFPALNNWFVRQVLGQVLSRVPYSGLAVSIITDPNKAAVDFAASQASRLPGGGVLGGLISSAANKPKEPDFPAGLTPDQQEQNPSSLTFNWKPFRKCKEYLVLVSKDEKMDALDWSARVGSSSAAYPPSAFPLSPGTKYFWRVIGLNNEGKPEGKASQTWFTVPSSYVPPSQ